VASLLAAPHLLPARVWGADGSIPPSERVTVAVIGLGAMGGGHLRRLLGDPSFQVLGVCDVDRQRREKGVQTAEASYGAARPGGTYRGVAGYNDYRDLLARADLDAVAIVTPDHWHAWQSIDAAKAGKDVYCEKPISVTIQEGRQVVEVMRRYGRVFQTGTQYRSTPTIRQVCQFIREGGLGRVKAVFTQLHTLGGWLRSERFRPYVDVVNPDRFGRQYVPMDFALPAEPVPEGLDWELWVGPAPWRPYNRLYHINPSPGVVPWAFDEAFGVTSSTWFLSHAADVIQYALGCERTAPLEVIHPNTGEFPTLTCRYASGTLLHFIEDWAQVKTLYHAVPEEARLAGMFGGVLVGERGWVTTLSTGGPIEAGPPELFAAMQLKTREVNIGANNHHANWLECIRTRQAPSSDEEIGHRSATLGHLTNIAYWTGRSLRWDPATEVFSDPTAANRMRARTARAPWPTSGWKPEGRA
jgi:hypothetical protein